jgi:Lrp/AsnC family transcriptional regulator for asnA, asnC and gidA
MKPRIDNIDRSILNCLHDDARMHCSEISRRLGNITGRAVRNRLDRLLKDGYIEIKAGAIPERLGFPISADIAMDVEPGAIHLVAQNLIDLDEVNYVAMTTGDTDISVSVVAASMGDLQTFLTEKLHSIPGVRKTKTYVHTRVLKQSCDWSFPEDLPKI